LDEECCCGCWAYPCPSSSCSRCSGTIDFAFCALGLLFSRDLFRFALRYCPKSEPLVSFEFCNCPNFLEPIPRLHLDVGDEDDWIGYRSLLSSAG
jgi:hypothetical protein